jgi:hypothetical protein
MSKKISTLIIAALLISNISFANIFRVGYSGPQLAGVDFPDAPTAVAAASAGDTIQLYPGVSAYLNSLSTKLVFIGIGYFLTNNTGLQVATTPAALSVNNMSAGASGSIFEGLQIYGTTGNAAPIGILQNILFTRCEIQSLSFSTSTAGDSLKNITFSQCYFDVYTNFYNEAANTTISGINYQNCITSTNTFASFYISPGSGLINNIIFENCSGQSPAYETGAISCYYRNCIFASEPGAVSGDIYDYCTFATNNTTHYVTGTSDQFGIAFSTIFSGGNSIVTGSPTPWDASWTLATGSPCIGYGRDFSNNPIDAGAYGGPNPYRLSGIPPIPAFYKLTAPSSSATANPYTITFSVRANN